MGRRGIHPGPHRLRQEQALIILGHAVSEDPGMRGMRRLAQDLYYEVPIEWIPAGEPFGRRSSLHRSHHP